MHSVDDLGAVVPRRGPARRVVCLVPSLTESLASVRPEGLVGATDWCTHPHDLEVARVRGTKNPDIAKIATLGPDLVVANKEENRELDVRRLRAAGLRVWVTDITTVPGAITSLSRLFDEGLGWPRPPWLTDARRSLLAPLPQIKARVAMPIWRDPWMVVGGRTFTSDLLRRLGYDNVYRADPERYPRRTPEEIQDSGADLILLPDEPYIFTHDDGPEAFTSVPTELVSGRLLTWYGPSMLLAAHGVAVRG